MKVTKEGQETNKQKRMEKTSKKTLKKLKT